MKEFGLQLWSIRDHFTNAEDTENSFRVMRDLGYTYAQTAGTYSYMPAEEFRALADKYGIRIVGTHYDRATIMNDVDTTVAYHKALGCKYIGIGGKSLNGKEDFLHFIDEWNAMAKIYGKLGFNLTYHNHAAEFMKVDEDHTYFDYLVERFDPVNCSFVVDAYWAQVAGIDVRDLIEKLGNRVSMIHLKDCQANCSWELANGHHVRGPEQIEVGRGNINFKGIIETAEKVGCKLFCVEDEYYSTGEQYDSIAISAANVKKKFLEK